MGRLHQREAMVVLDGVSTAVNKHLEAALRDLRGSYESRLGMKIWVETLCINRAGICACGFRPRLAYVVIFRGASPQGIKFDVPLDLEAIRQPSQESYASRS